jgi:hypothetical protein
MTIAQIEDEIRSLTPSERIELYRWLDYMVVADCNVDTSFCFRLGVDRSLETRHAIVSKSCGITARDRTRLSKRELCDASFLGESSDFFRTTDGDHAPRAGG